MRVVSGCVSAAVVLVSVLVQAAAGEKLFSIEESNIISEKCCDLTYKEINDLNYKIRDLVEDLVDEDYFKHYQFNLEMNCPFFECQSICFSPGCQLDLDVHSDDYDYDHDLDNKELSLLNADSFLDSLCSKDELDNGTEEDNKEWCDFDEKNGVIIDISRNPERFTGYLPTPERNIWGMIYQNQLEGECAIEQKVFYQIISGFHSSVSTHLCNEYYNNVTNQWEPNLELFNFKVGDHPERIENIYFNYAMIVRSILKIYPSLKKFKFNHKNLNNDLKIHKKLDQIVKLLPDESSKKIFNENIMFNNDENLNIKNEFRTKFKNITKLMDCVTCDRCRLWGKIQSTGYATALKILFDEPNEDGQELTKIEISGLFNLFDRLTKSIQSINNFNYLNSLAKQNEERSRLNVQTEMEDDEEELKQVSDKIQRQNLTIAQDLKRAFHEELGEFFDAFKFLYQSYLNLPKNLFNFSLYHLNKLWSMFIGDKRYNEVENKKYLYKIT